MFTARRRNKWIHALKESMQELEIFGPGGNPGAEKPPTVITKMPWAEMLQKTANASPEHEEHGRDFSDDHVKYDDVRSSTYSVSSSPSRSSIIVQRKKTRPATAYRISQSQDRYRGHLSE